jgi:adenine-specific DNA-methyltransferase
MIVAIDKNEQPRLQMLIEEIFPEYDVDCITVVHNPRGTTGTNFSYTHEFAIFVTPKGEKTICDRTLDEDEIGWSPLRNWGSESLRTDAKNCFYPIIVKKGKIVGFGDVCPDDYHPTQTVEQDGKYYVYPIDSKGVERKWRYARQSVEEIRDKLRAEKTKTGYDIKFRKDFGVYKTVWTDSRYDASVNGTQLLKSIIPDTKFSYPKSLYTVVDCVNAVVKNDTDAIILDFFGGSGTTGHAVMDINSDGGNRRFILVEQMNYIETETLRRNVEIMRKISPKSTITYFELSKYNQNIVEIIQDAQSDEAITEIWEKCLEQALLSYKINPKDINLSDDDFVALSIAEKKRFLMEILDKNQLYVNYCDIDDTTFAVSDEDKKFTKSFYEEVQ